MAEQASRLPSLRWFFTGLDDTDSFGTIAELGCQADIPLSYWSVGREVPEDIEPASPCFVLVLGDNLPDAVASRVTELLVTRTVGDDVVVLDADLEKTPASEVSAVRPVVTICDGRVTYER